jgi:mono/diheme cytochrome c family protein
VRLIKKEGSIMRRATWLLLAAFVVCVLGGCQSDDARFRLNMAYKKKMERQNLTAEEGAPASLPQQVTQDVADILVAMYGTPDAPQLPAVEGVELSQLVDLKRLRMAAGAVGSDQDGRPHGLYREHCVHCHGISGDGAGPTAAFLNPYPRDYRLGLYKFKSTKKGDKPTHDDLKKTLIDGIPGTAMPSFALLPDVEVEALVDYVKYLSIRGETERQLFRYATTELVDDFDTLYGDYISLNEKVTELTEGGVSASALGDAQSRLSKAFAQLRAIRRSAKPYEAEKSEEPAEKLDDEAASESVSELKAGLDELEKGLAGYQPPRLFRATDENGKPRPAAELKEELAPYLELAGEVMSKWIAPQSVAVPEPPTPLDANNKESLARGRAIFYGPIANCFSCHGESGLGDGQRDFYDDWSGEWVDKNDPQATDLYVALGALPPRHLIPRNLRSGVYRGGRRPIDLYWRIVNGIDGAQMPAVPLMAEDDPPGTKKLSQQDVWDLINYVRSLPYESISQPAHDEAQLDKPNL